VRLSKNHGSFVACLAGLTHATGRAVGLISADLQDPPELFLDMVKAWRDEGVEVVMAVRGERQDAWHVRALASIYYRILRRLALPEMPKGGFDFALLDRKVVDVLVAIREKNTTLMGLIIWCGFRRKELPYTRRAREHGRSMWTYKKKIAYFLDSIFAFSYVPIRAVSLIGVLSALGGLIYAAALVVLKLTGHLPPEALGWASLMVALLVLSGIQLLGLGILGEYLWRSFDETRARPTFIVDRRIGFDRTPVAPNAPKVDEKAAVPSAEAKPAAVDQR
jgi:dolichol-phosphate mannosyltransferase